MLRPVVRSLLLVSLLALLVSCGDQSPFMALKGGTGDMQITTVGDGQIVASTSKSVPLTISSASGDTGKDLEIEVTLTSPSGESVWHSRTAATLNTQGSVALPDNLPSGLYRLDFVLYSAGDVVQKKSTSFFVADAADGWKITGIRSFPPVITSAATVMLKAELSVPSGADPYLRWSWKGKVIARGTVSQGLNQILWTAPSDEGVYTILLEMFPSTPPSGSDFTFTSTLSMSTDVFVSGSKSLGTGDLGPEPSYLTLLHMQATLADSGAGARGTDRSQAVAIGAPEVVALSDAFGYRLDGTNGIRIPWFALPVDSNGVGPFTISLGVSLDDPSSADRLVRASTTDGRLVVEIVMDHGVPLARITSGGALVVAIPWFAAGIAPKSRVLLSLSLSTQGTNLVAQWFLDGIQVSTTSAPFTWPSVKQDGSLVIGGESGFSGVVDEFGVYYRDPAGRPSTDPGLFANAMSLQHRSSFVFADGFDGLYLPAGYTVEGTAQVTAGAIVLQPGSWLDLPGMKAGGLSITVTADVAPDSTRQAALSFQWEGSADQPIATTETANGNGLQIVVAADGKSVLVGQRSVPLPAAPGDSSNLLVKIGDPQESAAALSITQVLALTEK
ncbi:MAG TPA: hypothetical protein VHE79_11610 [Spirochaetia bacterium]